MNCRQSETGEEEEEVIFQDEQMNETTSPMFVGMAPISSCSLRMSTVGPVMREVPVSKIAWQPLGQKEFVPCTATLEQSDCVTAT